MKQYFVLGAACLVAWLTQAAPYLPEQLQLRVTVQPFTDLGIARNSMYNPRFFDGDIYANQISAAPCFGRYSSGSSTLSLGVVPALEHRMVAPFRGPNRSTYLLASGGAFSTTFTRYDFDGNNPQAVNFVDSQAVESFDWVDDDTIICTDYLSGNRQRLYLADVVAEPFAVSRDTTWNANGYITTTVSTRIRNVRVGDVYSGYAYYGDNGQADNPKVYAINLATGVETEVGSWAGTLKAGTAGGAASGSWGLWTVVERGGYLYLQTSDDGIQVYSMTSATAMGSLYATYTDTDLDAVTADAAGSAYYGFDVSPDGTKLLLGSYFGNVYEVGSPLVTISQSGTDVILSWPASVTAVVVQSSPSLSPPNFTDLDPQPIVVIDGKLNTTAIPFGAENAFFRLRKSP